MTVSVIYFSSHNNDLGFHNFDFLCHNCDLQKHDFFSNVAKMAFHAMTCIYMRYLAETKC